jgi:hypothetical protein
MVRKSIECWRGAKGKVGSNIIQAGYLCQLDGLGNEAVEGGIWEPVTSDSPSENTAKMFHCKSPIAPDWAHSLYTVRNMQERMNSHWTGGKSALSTLIVYSVHESEPL